MNKCSQSSINCSFAPNTAVKLHSIAGSLHGRASWQFTAQHIAWRTERTRGAATAAKVFFFAFRKIGRGTAIRAWCGHYIRIYQCKPFALPNRERERARCGRALRPSKCVRRNKKTNSPFLFGVVSTHQCSTAEHKIKHILHANIWFRFLVKLYKSFGIFTKKHILLSRACKKFMEPPACIYITGTLGVSNL